MMTMRFNALGTFVSLAIFLVIVSAQEDDFRCPSHTGFFPDPEQCDLYYKCAKDGSVEEKLCPDGLVFADNNPNHERCDIPSNIDCGERTILQPAKPNKGCPRQNGFYRHPDPEVCDKFINCVNGEPLDVPCPPGLIFDDVASTCAWPESSNRQDCLKSKKRDALEDGFQCPDDPIFGENGVKLPHPTYPHPDDCQKFYICRNGVEPQRGSCSRGLVYNDITFKCDRPENVPGCEDYFEGADLPESVRDKTN